MRIRVSQSFDDGVAPTPKPSAEDVDRGESWPLGDEAAEFSVRFFPPGTDYAVDIDIASTDAGPVVLAIKIRTAYPMEPRSSKRGRVEANWPKDLEVWSVRPRDVARLPLSRLVDLALLIAQDPMGEIAYEHKQPKHKQPKGATEGHLERVAGLWKEAIANEKNPYAEIARIESRRLGEPVPANRVYQWVHKCRRKGLLPEKPKPKPKPRRRKK